MFRFRLSVVPIVFASVAVALVGCASTGASPAATDSPAAIQASAAPSTSAATPSPSSSVTATTSPASGPTVALTEWKVTVSGTIKSGTTDLTISNVGAAPHELLIFKSNLDPSAYPTDAAGDIKEKGAGVDLVSDGDNIDPAGSQTRTIDLAPGKYLFVCNIPGHFKQGMFAVVTVAP